MGFRVKGVFRITVELQNLPVERFQDARTGFRDLRLKVSWQDLG